MMLTEGEGNTLAVQETSDWMSKEEDTWSGMRLLFVFVFNYVAVRKKKRFLYNKWIARKSWYSSR